MVACGAFYMRHIRNDRDRWKQVKKGGKRPFAVY